MSRPTGRELGRTPHEVRPIHPLDEDLLTRHHAKILNPADAVPAADGSTVMPTVYKPEWLLIPDIFFRDDDDYFTMAFGKILDQLNLTYRRPHLLRDDDRARQAVQLVRLDTRVLDRPIDAWPVLQALRVKAVEAAGDGDGRLVKMVDQISLRHLFFASTPLRGHALHGTPGMEGHHGTDAGRTSVYMPQSTLPPQESVAAGQRRPVVVVIDTGCGDHEWLSRQSAGGGSIKPPTAVVDDWTLQALNIIDDPETNPDKMMPLLGELDSHAGHGTFIAGIIRQLAPHAQIRTIRLMNGDGVVDEHDVEQALGRLVQEIYRAREQTEELWRFVDIVSMSFGGYAEGPSPMPGIGLRIEQLQDLGVLVVASAGNDAVEDELYPAAFPDVASVRALAQPDKVAIYGNSGSWVRQAAPGYAIVSTLPSSFIGSSPPAMVHRDGLREGFDQDRFRAGFGVWSGSSFAAAIFAGRAARTLWQWRNGAAAVAGVRPELTQLSDINSIKIKDRAAWAAQSAENAPWR